MYWWSGGSASQNVPLNFHPIHPLYKFSLLQCLYPRVQTTSMYYASCTLSVHLTFDNIRLLIPITNHLHTPSLPFPSRLVKPHAPFYLYSLTRQPGSYQLLVKAMEKVVNSGCLGWLMRPDVISWRPHTTAVNSLILTKFLETERKSICLQSVRCLRSWGLEEGRRWVEGETAV